MTDVTTKHVTHTILTQTCTTVKIDLKKMVKCRLLTTPDLGDVFWHTLECVRAQWYLFTKVSRIETSTIFIHITVITVQRKE